MRISIGNQERSIDNPYEDFHADLVVTNIHYDVMKHLINSKGFLNKGKFILSGLLRSQAEEINYILSQHPVKILKQWNRDGIWHTFLGTICQKQQLQPI